MNQTFKYIKRKVRLFTAVIFSACFIAACGGGGSAPATGNSAAQCDAANFTPAISYGNLTATQNIVIADLAPTTNLSAACKSLAAYSVASGALPAGLVLNTTTGVISGTPTAVGTSNFSVSLTLPNYYSVTSAPVTSTVSASSALCGAANYTAALSYGALNATTGSAITTLSPTHNVPGTCTSSAAYTVSAGNLPTGLNFNPATGVISGTPTAPSGAFTISLTVTGYAPVAYVITPNFTKTWTLMVYIAGDNNLSEFALADLNEIRAATANTNVNVVVQMEYNATFANSSIYTGGTTYRGLVTGASGPNLSSIGTVNMSDKASLTGFINYSKTSYPADKYALVLWSHGGGWKANKSYRGDFNVQRGALADDSVGGFMSMKDIKLGISNAMGTTKLDVLAFDACLMGHYEVAYELRNSTKYLVASEELVPGPGMPYTAVVNALTSAPTQTAAAFANAMAAAFNASYTAATDTTMSVFDTLQADALHTALLNLATALVANPESGVVTSAKAASNSYGGTGNGLFAIDLYKFANHVSLYATNATTRTAASAVTAAVTAAVGTRTYTTGTAMAGSKGVGIYFPPATAAELTAYGTASSSNDVVSGKSTWKDFLGNYYGGTAGTGTKVAGNFAYYITWDNSNADVDLVINEPKVNWASPGIGSTSPNGFLSADSYFSGQNFESYTAANLVDGGGSYDVFLNLYACKNGAASCAANVKLYKKDGLNAQFVQVTANGVADGSFYICRSCYTAAFPLNNITTSPYAWTGTWQALLTATLNSSDWYPISGAQVSRASNSAKLLGTPLKYGKFQTINGVSK
jgi:uncharacterized protein YfaP (DUF2135 family)